MFWGVVLEKNGENELDGSGEDEEMLHMVMEEGNIVHRIKRGRLAGLETCLGTVFYNTLLKKSWQ
jgi:hypothetical protein